MKSRFGLAASTLAAALALIACQDNATEPAARPSPQPTPSADVSSTPSDVQCTGILPPGAYQNVIVPPNGECFILNSVVQGNIKALENSLLFVSGGTTVSGSIQGDKALGVVVANDPPGNRNIVRGNIEIKEGSVAYVCGAVLPEGSIQVEKINGNVFVGAIACSFAGGGSILEKGNIKVEDNFIQPAVGFLPPFSLQIGDNLVRRGNLQVFKNRGPGEKVVTNNTIGQALQCFENTPPFLGGPNAAQKAEGQCFAGLVLPPSF
jgi:hypothetical protein